MATTSNLNFGPGTTTETLTGRAYTINEFATEYSNGNVPANVTLNLGNSNVTVDANVTGGIGVADAYYNYTNPATLTLDFANRLTTTELNVHAGNLTLNGHQLENDGHIYLTAAHAQINADVVGTGTWGMQLADLTLDGKVGSGQTFNFEGGPLSNLTIDDPKSFHGSLNLLNAYPDFGSVTLADLTATSYTYVNNSLTLYDGNHAVDHLRFADTSAFGVYQSAGGVVVSSNPQGTALPLHTVAV